MRIAARWIAATLLTALLLVAHPQSPVSPESLLIGQGDLLHIQVYDTPQMEQHVRVDDHGDVPLLFLGKVHVQGKTPADAAAVIMEAMQRGNLMHHPQVSVGVESFATQDVSIFGQVSKPGAYPISTPRPLTAVLSLAGGLNDIADRNVVIERGGDTKRTETVFVSHEQAADGAVLVRPGDTVIVPKAKLIYVLGDVARPGGYPLRAGDTPTTLVELLAQSGSPNKSAVLSHASLLHKTASGYTSQNVNLNKIIQGKVQAVELQPEDVLYLPFSYARSFVLNSAALATAVTAASVRIP